MESAWLLLSISTAKEFYNIISSRLKNYIIMKWWNSFTIHKMHHHFTEMYMRIGWNMQSTLLIDNYLIIKREVNQCYPNQNVSVQLAFLKLKFLVQKDWLNSLVLELKFKFHLWESLFSLSHYKKSIPDVPILKYCRIHQFKTEGSALESDTAR